MTKSYFFITNYKH